MNKQSIVRILRNTRLLSTFDYLRFVMDVYRNLSSNGQFQTQHPEFVLPPKFLAYDAYASTNAEMYYRSGRELAAYFAELIQKYAVSSAAIKIFEWGCGPARIIRHLPAMFPGQAVDVHGSDYNQRTIKWCQRHVPAITFLSNKLEPPVPCPDGYFDCIYNFSVFTHLSELSHYQWIAELRRMLVPGGILIMTTHGNTSRSHLLESEAHDYDAGNLVVRGKVAEGKRCYVAYHSPEFVSRKLLSGFEILEHISSPTVTYPQDVWVARKVEK
jgi:trans-aconitate methyltransferase